MQRHALAFPRARLDFRPLYCSTAGASTPGGPLFHWAQPPPSLGFRESFSIFRELYYAGPRLFHFRKAVAAPPGLTEQIEAVYSRLFVCVCARLRELGLREFFNNIRENVCPTCAERRGRLSFLREIVREALVTFLPYKARATLPK